MNIEFDDVKERFIEVVVMLMLSAALVVLLCTAGLLVKVSYSAIKGDSPQFCERSNHGH